MMPLGTVTAADRNSSLVGRRLAAHGAAQKQDSAPAVRAVPAAPDAEAAGAAVEHGGPLGGHRRCERAASEAQAAEGFRDCRVEDEAASGGSNDIMCEDEDTTDEPFLAMHAPCAQALSRAARVPRVKLSSDAGVCTCGSHRGEYRENNRSHIAEYDPNASQRSVLTIGSLASQVGSWHSSPAGSFASHRSPAGSNSSFSEVRALSCSRRPLHALSSPTHPRLR